MAETEALRNMVLTFRVSELQMLLGFAGRNKSGRKSELQARSLELLRLRSTPVQMKIKELYKSIQQGNANGLNLPPGSAAPQAGVPQSPVNNNESPNELPPPPPNIPHSSVPPQSQQRPPPTMYPGYNPQAAMIQQRPLYPGIYNPYQPKPAVPIVAPPVQMNSYPVHPDIKLKKLPFYEIMAEIMKPSTLTPTGSQRLQETSFVFHLTASQASAVAVARDIRPQAKTDMNANLVQIQVRFCLLEPTSIEQEDCFPSGVTLKMNGKIVGLPSPVPSNKPGVEPKRPPRPVNSTHFVKLSPTVANHVQVTWNTEYGRNFCIAIYLVRKLSSVDLLENLKVRAVRSAEYTKGLIRDKLNEDADSDIATTSLRVSLICPLNKCRMTNPCRSVSCYHLQCFDALGFLLMNEKRPQWVCPVCDKPTEYDNLVIDGYFQEVIDSPKLPSDASEVQLLQDGSWSILSTKKEEEERSSVKQTVTSSSEMILDDDDVVSSTVESASEANDSTSLQAKESTPESQPAEGTETESSAPKRKAAVIDLTLDDSDGEDEVANKTPKSEESSPSNVETAAAPTQKISTEQMNQRIEDTSCEVAIIDLTDD